MHNHTIQLTLDKRHVPFLFIVLFVFINALFNSLSSAYGLTHFPFDTFLFYASDLYADLIKMALGYLPNNIHLDTSSWDPLYQQYYKLHSDGWFLKHHFDNAHMPPLSYIIGWLVSILLQYTSPAIVIGIYYFVVLSSILFIAYSFQNNKKDFMVLSIGMIISYPLLFILTRGHIFSLISSLSILFYIYILLFSKKYLWIAVLLLAISINIRPNTVLLSVLFFVLPWREALKYGFLSAFTSILFFTIFLYMASVIDANYTLHHFISGLSNYTHLYVTRNLGVLFNNSLYGAIRTLLIAWKIHTSPDTLLMINTIILGTGIIALFLSVYLKIKQRLSDYEFAFILLGIYTLISTIFTTYHLFPYIIFLLIPFKIEDIKMLSARHYILIVSVSVFLLVPKNYLFIDFIYKNYLSAETILNPLVLTIAIIFILKDIKYE